MTGEKVPHEDNGGEHSLTTHSQTLPNHSISEQELKELFSISSKNESHDLFSMEQELEKARNESNKQSRFLDDPNNPKFLETMRFEALNRNILQSETFVEALAAPAKQLLSTYLQNLEERKFLPNDRLYFFNTWKKEGMGVPNIHGSFPVHSTSQGFFLRWQEHGVLVNPGFFVLEALQEKGLSIHEIDSVILTRCDKELCQAIIRLHELNQDLNRLRGKNHPIQFYLARSAYQELVPLLRPQYRYEKSNVHPLDLYLDTPDVETVRPSTNLSLSYFSLSSTAFHKHEALNLGIKLILESKDGNKTVSYVSETSWRPHLDQFLKGSDLLLFGFGSTSNEDLKKERYQQDCLGFYGSLSLLEKVSPKLAIALEFDSRSASRRLEIIKRLREDLLERGREEVLLPIDNSLEIDLQRFFILCSASKEFIDPAWIKVLGGQTPFSALQYLSPSSYI
jgi:hypothetical protein